MGWLKKDDRFPEHRKIRRLSDPQYRLHDTALHACAKDETDGIVTEADIADMQHGDRLRKHVDALVKAGLWHELTPGQWQINDYLDYNPSRAESEAKRKQVRDRQAKWRKSRTESDQSQRGEDVSNALRTRESHYPVPTRPDPSRPSIENSPSEGKETSVTRKESTEPPMQICGRRHPETQNCQGCARQRIALEEAERKEKLEAKSSAARHDARLRQEAIDACGMCDGRGYLANGKVCHHVESVGMSDSVRESLKNLKETK